MPTQTFDTAGNYTFTLDVMGDLVIQIWGGGGGGGGGYDDSKSTHRAGGGGGGGGFAQVSVTGQPPGGYAIHVGAGGAGDLSGAGGNGTDGEDSTFTTVGRAKGGSKGGGGNTVLDGVGGTGGGFAGGNVGDVTHIGGGGYTGSNVGLHGGGGGGAAGDSATGGAGSVTTPGAGGVSGGGAGGAGGNGANGSNAQLLWGPSGGGGGGGGGDVPSFNGGNGRDGKVVVTYTSSGGGSVSTWARVWRPGPPMVAPWGIHWRAPCLMTPNVDQSAPPGPPPPSGQIWPPPITAGPYRAPWNTKRPPTIITVHIPPIVPGGGGPGVSLPGRGRPLVRRVRETDSESGKNRQRNASEVTSSLLNSLLAQGQIVMTGANTYAIRSGAYTSTAAPTVDSDASHGFFVGQAWVVTGAGTVYFCVSNANGAANWKGPF